MKRATIDAFHKLSQAINEASATMPEGVRIAAGELDEVLLQEDASDAEELAKQEREDNREQNKMDRAERDEYYRRKHAERALKSRGPR